MKVVAIVQARMGSTRLPGKVMKPVNGRSMIEVLLSRLSQSEMIDEIVVATSELPENQSLKEAVWALGFSCFVGSEEDVLSRYYQAALQAQADIVIRITGDCPFVDAVLLDQCITEFLKQEVDYLSNVEPPTFPDGLDIEIFRFSALEYAHNHAQTSGEREHVTTLLRTSDKIVRFNVAHTENLSALRWTLDEPEDLAVITQVFDHFAPDIYFSWQDIYQLYLTSPHLFTENQTIARNEGAIMGTGQKLWKRAKQVISGGNMLLSKRPEMFLPEQWPAYFSKAKGCTVWDMDGREYIDMSIMGIGTNILGYGHPEIDAAVQKAVIDGNMSTLNAPEEVFLAEKLIELHPWADMARFARSGGEANAIAVRIARAASGKDKVAICGYHGWHDWYLSANLGDEKNLAGHLLPGLEPNGVPDNLRGTVFPFNYNQFDELQALVAEHDIGVIKMEVSRNHGPEEGFLQKVRDLATEKGIVLIFDECTSGFRETFGGLHKKYGVEPDMAMFGKTLGNGYAVTATIGRREVMEAAQTSFISSTFWTERIGSVAGLKTLEVMEAEKPWEYITAAGLDIRNRWQLLADKYGLSISHWGLPALTGFTVNSDDALAYKTLITQEMLKKGYLAGNSVYVCTEHTPEVREAYFENVEPIFELIAQCEHEKRSVLSLLDGPVCHSGFKRLN